MYEVFEHTADVGLRIRADSFENLLCDAASGLFSLIVANLDDVQPVQQRSWELEADSREYLLLDWLNELLYTFETEKLLLAQFSTHVESTLLRAAARGDFLDPQRHRLEHEVKAITYHGLRVVQHENRWLAEVIVDI